MAAFLTLCQIASKQYMMGPFTRRRFDEVLLKDRVAIVSGIGPGLGREIALALAREGADVALGARTEENLREVAAEVEAMGRRVTWRPTDIQDEEQCLALAEATREAFGRIDVLVNNAFFPPSMKRIEHDTIDHWRQSFEVNVLGSLQMTRASVPAMKEQGSGSIVFINTMSTRTAEIKVGAYAASKSAVLTMARVLARELGEHGIRVNSVVPGHVWGPHLEWYFDYLAKKHGSTPKEVYDSVANDSALRHIPTSAEVADAVVFFASDLSRVITGQSLDVNAGSWLE
jgi:NAD(P)-dependent dehydrogenase (short-subunit alcohol dehydrogenase family)